jgi:flagellar FliL protein
LLFAGGGVLLLLIGLGIGFFVFGGQPADPSEEIERIIERSDPEAAARAKAEAEAAASAESEVGEDGELLGPPQKVVKISPEVEIFQTTYYEFTGTLTTNLKNSRKFLQVGIGVSTQYDETVMENVDSHQLALRSEMLSVLSDFSVEQLQDKEGRQAVLDQLRDAMNAKLEELEGFGGVEGVHFTSFVVQ